jgi:hypothetical protein
LRAARNVKPPGSMRSLVVLVLALGAGGCTLSSDPSIHGWWHSSEYGFGSACYTALGGETVHVVASYAGGESTADYECTDHAFAIDVPAGSTNVTVYVFGDSGRFYDGNTRHMIEGAVETEVYIGGVSID